MAFDFNAHGHLPVIVHEDQATMRLAASLLQRDLTSLSGQTAQVATSLTSCTETCVVIGTVDSPLIKQLAQAGKVDLRALLGQWERYVRVAIRLPERPEAQVLVIAGSDLRGAIYGVVDLTRELGVSPWEWWADVTPQKTSRLVINDAALLSRTPSVQYRGIFLNDEDWGLQPWAAAKDPVKDIGPTTYARIFELMWRLKANLIWPAMHDSTRPFFQIDGNAKTAEQYAIVVGTSHAEPMMRNNVREWNSEQNGPFNFFVNRKRLVNYWEKRIGEVKTGENIYSVGLRGVHDSGMEGANTVEQARDTTMEVIRVQRDMLSRILQRPPQRVPQALTLYKEVLDVYKAGLKVPEDITLVWPDDNYGYLHQLSDANERKRSGGAGIYYHLSYWGRPHDYLWLGTTHPALIRDQLQRAWATGAKKLWVANVGDIKPLEYLTQYFLDMAFDARQLEQDSQQHLLSWSISQFGAKTGPEISRLMQAYYDLAWERRPEFMGFGQTEPTTPNRQTSYMASGGEEGVQRLIRYQDLATQAEKLANDIPPDRRDAYFELVLYPVRAAANLNKRILDLDLATENARQGRPAANYLVGLAKQAHGQIVSDTAAYNGIANGKWRNMMDMAPRRLPVFSEPVWPVFAPPSSDNKCDVAYPSPYSVFGDHVSFRKTKGDSRTVSLVNYTGQPLEWKLAEDSHGVSVRPLSGKLDHGNGFEQRIEIRYDGADKPVLALQCGNATVKVNMSLESASGIPSEQERRVTIIAGETARHPDWEAQPGLGSSGKSLRTRLDLPLRRREQIPSLDPLVYQFETSSEAAAQIRFIALPTHPLTAGRHVRLAFRLDEGAVEVVDYETFGRSDEWKANVLANAAVRSKTIANLKPGKHTLRVYALDPGVVLDRIDVVLDGAARYYGMPPQASR